MDVHWLQTNCTMSLKQHVIAEKPERRTCGCLEIKSQLVTYSVLVSCTADPLGMQPLSAFTFFSPAAAPTFVFPLHAREEGSTRCQYPHLWPEMGM